MTIAQGKFEVSVNGIPGDIIVVCLTNGVGEISSWHILPTTPEGFLDLPHEIGYVIGELYKKECLRQKAIVNGLQLE